ncbi:hypothetical protein LC76P1_00065 [Lysinibacillus phage LC76P1]|nr:hypothetical protein LC76P1_00065 [Lysinibacillus phage LC76P1]
MNVGALKQYLIDNDDQIALVLHKVGFCNIDGSFSKGTEWRCSWDEDSNPTSVAVKKNTLKADVYSKNIHGDIINLVEAKTGLGFSDTIKLIADIVLFKDDGKYDVKKPAFGGFLKRVKRLKEPDGHIELEEYPESILDKYMIMPSQKFLEDGISYDVQVKYQIGYDWQSNRIIVPWRGVNGQLIGIMGRINKYEKDILPNENKWFPIIPFPKSQAIFGYSQNYTEIQKVGMCIIGESEKFPQQLESKGLPYGLGLGGNKLSVYQAQNIKATFADKIFVAMDEGLDIDVSIEMAKKLKMEGMFSNDTYYIHDKNNLWLPKASKMSLSDLPASDIKSVIRQCSFKI